MKTRQLKKILAAVALAGFGLAASGAQAGDYPHGRGEFGSGRGDDPSYARYHDAGDYHWNVYQQSRMFSQQVDARQDRQMERIKAGMRSGTLTRFEFRELMHEQRRIRDMEQYFLADGMIDAREFERLDRALDLASRNIMEEKHDRQARFTPAHEPWFN